MNDLERHYERLAEGRQLKNQFFFHWSLLSAGTITLVITYVGDTIFRGRHVSLSGLLYLALPLFILSIITASLRNFYASQMLIRHHTSELRGQNEDGYLTKIETFINICQLLAVSSYIIAITLLSIMFLANVA